MILTGEPALVSLAASLLENVLQHNIAALATLYQTGIYFFGLAYCGSNLSELARLFKVWSELKVLSAMHAWFTQSFLALA